MKTEMVERFFEWVNERHFIYLLKEVDEEPWPWTNDPILKEYKFTNVFRELDTGTVWLRENWLEPFRGHPKLYFNIAMYRQFNWPPTMDYIGFQTYWFPDKLTDEVEDFQRNGNKVWTGAYMIRGPAAQSNNPATGERWTSKAQYMFHLVLDPIWKEPEPEWTSLEEAWKWWMQWDGFGPFLSYEVVTDMRHTRYLKNAPDIMTWANAGPGAIRGVNRIHGLPLKTKKRQDWYCEQMRRLLFASDDYLEEHVPPLEMRDIEHSLCEFDKYERVRLGQGRPRSKYSPPS